MTIIADDPNVLTPLTLNNFLVCNRDVIRQARVHLIHHHSRRIKVLTRSTKTIVGSKKDGDTQRQDGNSASKHSLSEKNKNKKKALRMSQEIKAVKHFSDGDLMKLVLLNTKTFEKASRDGSSPGYRAVCRVAEHPAVAQCKAAFKTQFQDSIPKLPFCIKVLGIQRRYKKIRKVGKEGKKQKFLDTERVCFRLLQEIGGAEFVAAEDLYKKIRNKKLREKEAAKAKASADGEAPHVKNEGSDQEEGSSSEEDGEQRHLRDKIFQKLDDQFGKWDDDELSEVGSKDSDDSEDTHQSSTLGAAKSLVVATKLPVAAPAKSDREQTSNVLKRKFAYTEVDTEKRIKLSQTTESRDNMTGATIGIEIQEKIDDAGISDKNSPKFFTIPKKTVLKELGSKRESADTVKVDEISKPTLIPFAATDKIKPIDLNKIARNTMVIPLVSKKSTAELLSVDDRMPKKLAYRKARQQKAKSELDSMRNSSGPSFFAGRNDCCDEADDEVGRGETEHGDSGWGMGRGDTGRGRGRGDAVRGRGDEGRGRADAGRGRGRSDTGWGMDRGESGRVRGRGRGDAGRGRGRGNTATGPSRDDAGQGLPHASRGTFSRGGARGATGGGPNRAVDSQSKGGHASGSWRGTSFPEGSTSNDPSGGTRDRGSSSGLHPSWDAKKKQKSGITNFLGKKTTFE